MSIIIWKTLKYNGETYDRFEVSNDGQLRNVKTGTIYKQAINQNGYKQVCVSLGKRNKKKVLKIHKAVAETFLFKPENKNVVNHIDGNKQNNFVDNLEWTTDAENTRHAFKNGLAHPKRGIDNPSAKLSIEDVNYIRKNYIPNDKQYGSRALGRKFGIDHCSILNIVKYKSYQDMPNIN